MVRAFGHLRFVLLKFVIFKERVFFFLFCLFNFSFYFSDSVSILFLLDVFSLLLFELLPVD